MTFKTDKHGEAGFTLIELAISTIIIGLLISAVLFPYTIWQEKQKYEQTVDNVEDMAWGVAAYRTANDHYPCPAPFEAKREDGSYGRATQCFDTGSVAVNTCGSDDNSYCRVKSNIDRIVTGVPADGVNYIPGADDFTPTIRIGMLPFRDLNFPEEMAYDENGNRLVYAVTEEQAWKIDDSMPPNENFRNSSLSGGIDIVYDSGSGALTSRLTKPHSVNYVVLSHGNDGRGGINIYGENNGEACNESSPDGENCKHYDGSGLDNRFYASDLSTDTGNDTNDDIVVYQIPANSPLWARSAEDPANIFSIASEANPDGRVGSDYTYNYYEDEANHAASQYRNDDGTPNVEAREKAQNYHGKVYDNAKLWVAGNVLVQSDSGEPAGTTGRLEANNLCGPNGEDCFPANILGGVDGIDCTNEFMQGVRRKDEGPLDSLEGDIISPDCSIEIEYPCDSGELLKKVENGVATCVPKPCAAETINVCSVGKRSIDLPNAESGTQISERFGNNFRCARGTFTCRNGSWEASKNNTSLCACTNKTEVETSSCPSNCVGSGREYTEVTECTSCRVTRTRTKNNCNCNNNSSSNGSSSGPPPSSSGTPSSSSGSSGTTPDNSGDPGDGSGTGTDCTGAGASRNPNCRI